MPPGFSDEGLRAAVALRKTHPGLAVLVLSQYIEKTYAGELLDSGDGTGVGYLLKDRVGDVAEFIDALQRVAAGGTVVDPEVVRQLLRHRRDPLERLSPREREVLALMAEGRSNAAVARALVVSEAAVGKHIGHILTKLDLPPDDGPDPPASKPGPPQSAGRLRASSTGLKASRAAAELADHIALVDSVPRAPVHRLVKVERDRQFSLGLVGHLPKSGPAQDVNDVIPGDFHPADCRV